MFTAIRTTKSGSSRKRNEGRITLTGPDNQSLSINNGEVLNNQPGIERRNPTAPAQGNLSVPYFNSPARGQESNPFSTTVIGVAPPNQSNQGQQTKPLDSAQQQFGQPSQYQQGPTFSQTIPPPPIPSQGIQMQTIPSQSNPNIGIGGSGAPVQ